MAGLGLKGADIEAVCNGKTYSNNKEESIEIPVEKQGLNNLTLVQIKEKSSKTNFENVFENKVITLGFKIDKDYKLRIVKDFAFSTENLVKTNLDVKDDYSIQTKYLDVLINNIEGNTAEISANIKLKNPIKYNLEVVKEDLSGNEISGEDLKMEVISDNVKSTNNGKSTISLSKVDLAPNTVNTYVINELSTLAPYVNELVDKKLTAQVRADENGELIMQKFEITDKDGKVCANTYVDYETNAKSADGTRLVKIIVKNPMTYKFKLTKVKTKKSDGTYEELQGASIQVNDMSNLNGSSNIETVVNDVKIGDKKTFTIKENSTTVTHDNILKDCEIELTTIMGSDKKVHIYSAFLINKTNGKRDAITEAIKAKYRFSYGISSIGGIQTVNVNIQNPIKFNVKLVKYDGTSVTELSGTELELYKGKELISTNKDTGASVLEYTQNDVAIGDSLYFKVLENKSISPNVNILENKELGISVKVNDKEGLDVTKVTQQDINTAKQENVSKFITVDSKVINEIPTLIIKIDNPVTYDLDLIKNAAGIGFLENTKFKIYRADLKDAVFDGYVTDVNSTDLAEFTEQQQSAGKYTYYITETKTASQRYVNILSGKYVKINVDVSGRGKVTILNNDGKPDQTYYEIYEGNVADRKDTDKLVDKSDIIYQYINVGVLVDNITGKNRIQCNVTNPVTYMVELEKTDSADKPLKGADFELQSSVINSQSATKTEMKTTVGVTNIDKDGKVTGTTNDKGNISYQETFVKVGTYEYTLKETKTPGAQYVNPLDGYTVHFKVTVDKDGNINLEQYSNGKLCFIEKSGVEASDDLYSYMELGVNNNLIIAKLHVEVENPVKYDVNLEKTIYGDENLSLSGAKFKIESSLIKLQNATKTDMKATIGVTGITKDGIISGTTNKDGNIKFEETMVRPGTYEYWISELETGDKDIVNAMKDTFIKVYVKVSSDGTINTVTEDGKEVDGTYYLYKSDKKTKLDFSKSSVDELVKVYVTKQNAVNTLHIAIKNPQKYNLSLRKTDIDTKENMNNVKFQIKTYKLNKEGKQEEISLRKAYDNTQSFDTSELITNTVNKVDGVISINDILIERAGTYYYEFIETTPKDPIIYKDKSENVIVKVDIAVENGKYVVKNMKVCSGAKYTISKNTNITESTVNVNVTNERVKGSYDIQITKLEELLHRPIKGSKFIIEAFKQNEDGSETAIELYKSTDNVNSKDIIVPGKFTINSDDGVFSINDIRIENLDSYILKITEVEAPETYTILRDPIIFKFTPKISGQYDDAKYVIDSINMISGDNDGLVSIKNTEEKVELEVINNQFDLALRKYVSSINGEDVSRWTTPEVDTSKLATGEATTAEYYNGKAPLRIYADQDVIYTLRVYNEGQIDGYANEIVDHLPEQLEFLPDDEFNKSRGWSYVENDNTMRAIKTDYLSKDTDSENNLIKAYNAEKNEINYKEVQVKCRVKSTAVAKQLLTNIAEISKYEGYNRPNVIDRDSTKLVEIPKDEDLPSYKQDEIEKSYVPGQEDDDDFEKLIVEEFDLALRKYVTQINNKNINTRLPVFKIDANGNYVYEQDKTPLEIAHKNTVEYTIGVYNEGTVSGYANLVKDSIPDGLVFVPDNETNIKYKWKMLDVNGNETKDTRQAKYIVTDYLSKENGEVADTNANVTKQTENSNIADTTDNEDSTNKSDNAETTKSEIDKKQVEKSEIAKSLAELLNNANIIKAFDKSTMKEPDHKELKAIFTVNVPKKSSDNIINEAQISDDTDEYGKTVKDKDSTTDVWVDGDDDQDKEYLKLVYFDLSLKKWVSQAIVNENGVDKVIETGHTGDENPEGVVKVDLVKKKLNNVVVKFRYQIKVTNEGTVPGYVKEISDYIPEGLRFEQSDNPTWEQVDGKVVTTQAAGILLQPKESTTVAITLTWINSKDNLGLKINTAEISEDYNDYGDTPDIDSTPNNHVDGEDDIDTAPVMLTVKTGSELLQYLSLALATITILCTGIVLIKKKIK